MVIWIVWLTVYFPVHLFTDVGVSVFCWEIRVSTDVARNLTMALRYEKIDERVEELGRRRLARAADERNTSKRAIAVDGRTDRLGGAV